MFVFTFICSLSFILLHYVTVLFFVYSLRFICFLPSILFFPLSFLSSFLPSVLSLSVQKERIFLFHSFVLSFVFIFLSFFCLFVGIICLLPFSFIHSFVLSFFFPSFHSISSIQSSFLLYFLLSLSVWSLRNIFSNPPVVPFPPLMVTECFGSLLYTTLTHS